MFGIFAKTHPSNLWVTNQKMVDIMVKASKFGFRFVVTL